jgi:hypothetical protein
MLQPQKMPSMALMPGRLAIAPTMQTIIVDRVPIVNPQLATVIRNNAESVMSRPPDPRASCPAYCKMIASAETWPIATCVAVIHHMTPTSHVRPATIQVLTPASLPEVESVLHE